MYDDYGIRWSETQNISVLCDATDLVEGNYYGEIIINSNYPFYSKIIVEIYFTVGDLLHDISINFLNNCGLVQTLKYNLLQFTSDGSVIHSKHKFEFHQKC